MHWIRFFIFLPIIFAPVEAELTERERYIASISSGASKGYFGIAEVEKAIGLALNKKLLTINEIKEIFVQIQPFSGLPAHAVWRLQYTLRERQDKRIADIQGKFAETPPFYIRWVSNLYGKYLRNEYLGKRQLLPCFGSVSILEKFWNEHIFVDVFSRGLLNVEEKSVAIIAALYSIKGGHILRHEYIEMGKKLGLSQEDIQEIRKIAHRGNFAWRYSLFGPTKRPINHYYKGQVGVLVKESIGVTAVVLPAGVRGRWRRYSKEQIMLITDGRGYYQEKGGAVQEVSAGDVIRISPNTIHWVSADVDEGLAYAILEIPYGSTSEWFDEINEDEYKKITE